MGSASLFSIGVSALTANYAALQTTSNNISNANVAGYSRESVQVATAPSQFTGAGYVGSGVDVTTISRAYNSYLTSNAATAQSLSSMDSTSLTQLQSLQNSFQIGSGSLGDSVNQLFSSISAMVSNPGDLPTRQVVLGQASALASNFNAAGSALQGIQSDINQQMTSTVSEVNGLAQNIASLNTQIAQATALGQPPNQLLDQRDQQISQLSSDIQVSRVNNADGTVSLFIGGGQTLVLGSNATALSVVQDPSNPSRSALAVGTGSSARALNSASLGGGSIAGLLNFQNNNLAQGIDQVGQLAASVAGALNQAQAQGLTLQSPLGQTVGSPMFSIGAPQAISNANNAKDPVTGSPLGSVSLTVTDPSALQASDYTLTQNASSGNWQLTRLSDNTVTTVTNGSVVDGMQISINNAQPGDSFLLQPVAQAATGLTALLKNPAALAAASPLVASTASTNKGTASITSLQVASATLPTPGATSTITFTDGSGDYTWQLQDANGNSLGSGSGTWQAGQSIPTPPQDINGFTLQLSGAPATGDVITVAPTPASAVATNNGNATNMLALQNTNLVAGQTPTNAWAQAVSVVGVQVQNAQAASNLSTAAATQAATAQSSVSGVNMDEEASNLIQYQQSYQAAAKILQVAQAVFATLLQTAGG
jgi:flagellar hook-associated protein 1 FlgK